MRKSILVIMCLSLCLLVLSFHSAGANEGIAGVWQMDYAESACSMLLEAAANCSLCHTTEPEVNSYGQAIADAGFGWFVVEAIDSDGDGRTNGEEIYNDCTLPGDILSPIEKNSWSNLKALFFD
jgi:hypothetical protein